MKLMKVMTLLTLLLISLTAVVFAQPTGPQSITVDNSERRNTSSIGVTVQAEAGNMTQLTVDEVTITNKWQGYFGNITGTITLDDAGNNTLYDWSLGSPQGEIYASNWSSVTWADIKCFNFTSNLTDGWTMNITHLELAYDDTEGDNDGVNETFNQTYTSSFQVGTVTIDNSGGCPQTNTFVKNTTQADNFTEVILTDNVSVIYTAILEQDVVGYDGATWDFQMLVGENGNESGVTNYYFYVELS